MNRVKHVVNLSGETLPNIFDQSQSDNEMVRIKLNELNLQKSPLIGQIKYKTVHTWDEYHIPLIQELNFVKEIYGFIEEATRNYKSSLIVSSKNKCSTAVIAIVFLMFKFKWSAMKALEFLNNRKNDIEITVGLIKELQMLEQLIESQIKLNFVSMDPMHPKVLIGLRQNWRLSKLNH